jgi:DNA/RNA-binding domain of Phe-tRNA-synthetase-like protein
VLFRHDQALFHKYPWNYSGLMYCSVVPPPQALREATQQLRSLEADQGLAARRLESVARWREVFSRMGAKRPARSSLEALLNFWSKKGTLYAISPIVDFYNWYSFIHGVPMAAYDVRMISWPLCLTESIGNRTFVPLNRPDEIETTENGEVAYIDTERVVCRYWNLQDCDHTKITDNTAELLFVFDILDDLPDSARMRFQRICDDFSRVFGDLGENQCGLTGPNVATAVLGGE